MAQGRFAIPDNEAALPHGVRRFTLPMPPPLAHVHVWLIQTGDGWAMFDTGFPSPEGVHTLEREITPLLTDGRRLEAAFISHYHPDHTAFAGWLQHHFGTEVFVHEADWERMQMMRAMNPELARRRFSGGWAAALDEHEFANGTEPNDSMFSRMREMMESIDLPAPEPTLISGGEVLTIGGRKFDLVWTPGHTEGHLCVLDRDEDILFTGDHLLARITPHIGMWPDDQRSPLAAFEQSLDLVTKLHPSIALPAHERIIDRPAERAQEILEHHQIRRREAVDAVGDGDGSVRDIAVRIFPKRAHDRSQLTMAMSETVAHLEALVEEGVLVRSGDGVDRRYQLA